MLSSGQVVPSMVSAHSLYVVLYFPLVIVSVYYIFVFVASNSCMVAGGLLFLRVMPARLVLVGNA